VKRLNARRVKIHRTYTVDEAARLFKVHKNAVRSWIKSGLPTVDDRRPTLALGSDIVRFLSGRRRQRKRRCAAGQLSCVCCRAPQRPVARMADYVPITATVGNLRGICPDYQALMYRLLSLAGLAAVAADLDVQVAQGQCPISD
jgi:hypothetical protein